MEGAKSGRKDAHLGASALEDETHIHLVMPLYSREAFVLGELMGIYHLTSRWKIYYLVGVLSFYAPILSGILYWTIRNGCIGLVFVFVFGIQLFLAIYNIWNQCLTISESGLEYNRLGLDFEVDWESIQKSGSYIFWSGLFADKSSIRIRKWFLGTIEMYMGFGQSVFIPVSCFAENWRESLLGQFIQQNAPHLFL